MICRAIYTRAGLQRGVTFAADSDAAAIAWAKNWCRRCGGTLVRVKRSKRRMKWN